MVGIALTSLLMGVLWTEAQAAEITIFAPTG